MICIAKRFKKLRRGWNSRTLTEKDFWALCKKHGVEVYENSGKHMKWKGVYTVLDGIPTIIIDPRLKGLERLWTLFHELGHHLLHSPETCFFSDSTVHKAQSEANAFAAIALIPEKYVRQVPLWDVYDVDEFAAKLFQIRLGVFDLYKI
ncbi:MAG TPA: ImmA/IrrE family metallo-endopeptidase [Pyrinomonadaceae bacterium]|jgi:Zn-dependent peptidase ImmA (M78 family)